MKNYLWSWIFFIEIFFQLNPSLHASCLEFKWNPIQHRIVRIRNLNPNKTDSILVHNTCPFEIHIDSIYMLFPKIDSALTGVHYWDPSHHSVSLNFDLWRVGKTIANSNGQGVFLKRLGPAPHILDSNPYFLVPEPVVTGIADKLNLNFNANGNSYLGNFFSDVDICPACKVTAGDRGIYDSLAIEMRFFSSQGSSKTVSDTLKVIFESRVFSTAIRSPQKRAPRKSFFQTSKIPHFRYDGKKISN